MKMENSRRIEDIIRQYGAEKTYLKPGKIPLQLVLNDARERAANYTDLEEQKKLYKQIELAERRGLLTGELHLTYEGAEKIFRDLTSNLSSEHKEVIESFDKDRDADLIANYFFAVHPEISKKVESVDNLYRVILKLGSKKKSSSSQVKEKESQEHDTDSQEDMYDSP